MNDPAIIVTERLTMPLLTATRLERLLACDMASVEAEVAGLLPRQWVAENARLMRFRLVQIQGDPAAEQWLLRPILRADDGQPRAIGLINFHGPPDERGFAEVGYGLEPAARGHGYAIEAVEALFGWAAAEHGVRRFRASISPDNLRSQNLVRKLGMEPVGSQWDETDGLEVIWTVDPWPLA